MPSVDHVAQGYVLTTADAAHILGRTPAEVHDLVFCYELKTLIVPESPSGPLAFRYHPDDVGFLEVRLRESAHRASISSDTRNRLRMRKTLRHYLASAEPTDDYDEALTRHRPLLCRVRGGALMVHVRTEAVVAFAERTGVPLTRSIVNSAMEHFGALRVRGVSPVHEEGQRWGIWYRLPEGFMPGEDDDATAIRALTQGARRPGERVSRPGAAPAVLAGVTLGLDDGYDDDSSGGNGDGEPAAAAAVDATDGDDEPFADAWMFEGNEDDPESDATDT
jgi:hypothetical protein